MAAPLKPVSIPTVIEIFQKTIMKFKDMGMDVESDLKTDGETIQLSIKATNIIRPPGPR